MRLIFLGSGEFGLPTLQRLHEDHQIAAVISQPDRPAGRHRRLTPTPIAAWAEQQDLDVLKAEDVNAPGFVRAVRELEPEAAVIIAFGQKLSEELVESLGRLAVNLHASLLPKYRGAAPINWALIGGESETGVSVIGLAQRMDAGPVYATARTAIEPHETAGELHDRLAQLGPDAVSAVLDDLAAGKLSPTEQDESLATKAPKLRKADGTVSFDQPAEVVRNRVHGLTPWPGCRVCWQRDGKQAGELILRRVETADVPSGDEPGTVLEGGHVAAARGAIKLLELQAPGTRPMPFADFQHGHGLRAGDRLAALGA